MGRSVQVVIGRKYAKVIQVVGGTTVVSVGVLELAKVVQYCDLLQCELMEVLVRHGVYRDVGRTL